MTCRDDILGRGDVRAPDRYAASRLGAETRALPCWGSGHRFGHRRLTRLRRTARVEASNPMWRLAVPGRVV
jgi:hypothetical protein